jgi:hypothetical protein
MRMDYKELLIKYINHVADNEGVTFIKDTWKGDGFTEEQWAELVTLDEQAWKQINGEIA